ncbi:HNH endonuclease [Paracoccus gahaiensis]|uniref:HNH endonuclease n=1 Tax=Paracoccus gahaiensis TaxID=1706839 RepID=A0A4U0R8Q6_9RHOB|nr:HNH endonuclease signature motif containing protein [Paracoccus gahaiensis]TJZ91511.1 HNH endonuclease [Paracoccus gahaiensis]
MTNNIENKSPRLQPSSLHDWLLYDRQTGRFTWKIMGREWFDTERQQANRNKRCAGKAAFTSAQSKGHLCAEIRGRTYLAHQVAWALEYGYWPPEDIDHINGDPSDNRINNLRAVSRSINAKNRRGTRQNSNIMITASGSFKVKIQINGKSISKTFHTEPEAFSFRDQTWAANGFTPRHGRLTI